MLAIERMPGPACLSVKFSSAQHHSFVLHTKPWTRNYDLLLHRSLKLDRDACLTPEAQN